MLVTAVFAVFMPPETRIHQGLRALFVGQLIERKGCRELMQALRLLDDQEQDLGVTFVGEGPLVGDLKEMSSQRNLSNVLFVPFQPRDRVNEVQALADISLVSLSAGADLSSVPSKVLGYMAAARPVIAAVDSESETAGLIRAADCGLVVDSADDLPEIREVIENTGNIDPEKVMLMPQAKTRDELLAKSVLVSDLCKKNGFAFCQRLQLLLWDGQATM